MARPRDQAAAGITYGVAGQLIWGVQPLFWPLLDTLATSQIVAHRIVWSCLAALTMALVAASARTDVAVLLRSPPALRSLARSGVMLGASWAVYVYAIVSGQVVEASLALLIAPLAGALIGVAALDERMRRAQWCACGVAAVALAVLVATYRAVPWVALAIAATVSVYAYERKRRPLPAVAGSAIELAAMMPFGLAIIVWTTARGDGGAQFTPAMLLLLPAAGLITALPSILRLMALSRIPLSAFSLLMYLNPALQFAIGVGVRHEPMTPARWTGFALVWAALALFATDAVRHQPARTAAPPVTDLPPSPAGPPQGGPAEPDRHRIRWPSRPPPR